MTQDSAVKPTIQDSGVKVTIKDSGWLNEQIQLHTHIVISIVVDFNLIQTHCHSLVLGDNLEFFFSLFLVSLKEVKATSDRNGTVMKTSNFFL